MKKFSLNHKTTWVRAKIFRPWKSFLLGLGITLVVPALGHSGVDDLARANIQGNPTLADPIGQSPYSRTLPKMLKHLELFTKAHLEFVKHPITVSHIETDQLLRSLLTSRIQFSGTFAMGLFNQSFIALHLPLALYQEGEYPGRKLGEIPKFGLDMLTVWPEIRIWKFEDIPLQIHVAFPIRFPTGTALAYLGHEKTEFSFLTIIGSKIGNWDFGGRFQWDLKPQTNIFAEQKGQGYIDDDWATLATGISYTWPQALGNTDLVFGSEIYVGSRGGRAFTTPGESRSEILGSILLQNLSPGTHLRATVGTSLLKGVTIPSLRALIGIEFNIDDFSDEDYDDIDKANDQCPMDPEDYDRFKDQDGCPEPDNDQDSILDAVDQCPNKAEDMDGFSDTDGCPEPDNDQDGILDQDDKCPNKPEDFDTFEDEDGCPDPDNDQDKIIDSKDLCPLEPETINDVDDKDGCPELDKDQDGLVDSVDKCPLEAEILNNFEDEDGCPDEGPPLIRVKSTEIEILMQKKIVFYEVGRARLLKQSKKVLDTVVSALKNHREILQVRVIGHTDRTGRYKVNLEVSKLRAKWVRWYLIQNGIAPERIITGAKASKQPIATNKTKRGRQKNRRTVFQILKWGPVPKKEKPKNEEKHRPTKNR
ncbi:MAG: OmpA family protein [Myxococcota bacterium]|nr:OmpA family protein [Myxococcota bacterium]